MLWSFLGASDVFLLWVDSSNFGLKVFNWLLTYYMFIIQLFHQQHAEILLLSVLYWNLMLLRCHDRV
jgi:hypothetical protein